MFHTPSVFYSILLPTAALSTPHAAAFAAFFAFFFAFFFFAAIAASFSSSSLFFSIAFSCFCRRASHSRS